MDSKTVSTEQDCPPFLSLGRRGSWGRKAANSIPGKKGDCPLFFPRTMRMYSNTTMCHCFHCTVHCRAGNRFRQIPVFIVT